MEDFEEAIWLILMLRSDHAYITPDGHALYVLANEELLRFDSEQSFWTMTDVEVNSHIQTHIKK